MSAQGGADSMPMCDTCDKVVAWHEAWRWGHVTTLYPFGAPKHVDISGHEATTRAWAAS